MLTRSAKRKLHGEEEPQVEAKCRKSAQLVFLPINEICERYPLVGEIIFDQRRRCFCPNSLMEPQFPRTARTRLAPPRSRFDLLNGGCRCYIELKISYRCPISSLMASFLH